MVEFWNCKRYSMISDNESWDQMVALLREIANRHPKGICLDFGAAGGGTAMILASLFSGYCIIGIDTFLGFPQPSPQDSGGFQQGEMQSDYHYVRNRLDQEGFGHVELVRTTVEEWVTWPESNYKVAAAVVDLNLYNGTKDALQWLEPRMSKNGIVVLDDFDYSGIEKAIEDAGWKESVVRFGRMAFRLF